MRNVTARVVPAALAAALLISARPASASQSGMAGGDLAMAQANGIVWSVAYAQGAVYAAGDFTSLRPSGAAAGTGEQARNHLALINSATGALLPTIFSSNGRLPVVAAASDGSRVFAGGTFTTFAGAGHGRLVAINAATRTVVAGWHADANGTVTALAATPTTLYVAGSFTQVNGQPRAGLAAVDAATGSLRPWAPTVDGPATDGTVHALAVSEATNTVYLGGDFDHLNGVAHHAVGALDATTGGAVSFPAASAMPARTATCTSKVKGIDVAGSAVYFGAEGTGGGCYDGTFAARTSDGTLLWDNTCRGATQAVQVIGNWLFKGSHAHDCQTFNSYNDPDAFPEVSQLRLNRRYLLAERLDNGFLGTWYPEVSTTNPATQLGPYGLATDGSQLFAGGDFTTVAGHAQQNLARFAPGDTRPGTPGNPVAVANAPGQLTVFVKPPQDPDDVDLTVDLYRGTATTPTASRTVHNLFWQHVPVAFVVTGLAAGTAPTFRAVVRPTNGGTASLSSAQSSPVTVISARTSYPTAVTADSPMIYWRLGDRAGSLVAADYTAHAVGGLVDGNPQRAAAGGLAGDADTAFAFHGGNDEVSTPVAAVPPSTFSTEVWFRTTTTTGGNLLSSGSRRMGTSVNYDRTVYLTNAGRLIFGVYNHGLHTLTSPAAYNNGGWHQVVATDSSTGMALYVDGTLVASGAGVTPDPYGGTGTGYWRVGNNTLTIWPSAPTTSAFTGSIDEVAIYDHVLTAARVSAHFAAR